MKQPRRYQTRRLHDVSKLSQREIAERLGVSAATVNRDLAETVAPVGFTDQGTPYYPPGRFDRDLEYVARVNQLASEMPQRNARLIAAKEFAGSRPQRTLRGQIVQIRSDREKQKLLADFDRGKLPPAA